MHKKLRMSLNFSKLAVAKLITSNHHMHNLYTKFIKILGICKQFSNNLVNEQGNVPRRGPVPKFSDLEIVALSLAAKAESIDSEKWLFETAHIRLECPYRLNQKNWSPHSSRLPRLVKGLRHYSHN